MLKREVEKIGAHLHHTNILYIMLDKHDSNTYFKVILILNHDCFTQNSNY